MFGNRKMGENQADWVKFIKPQPINFDDDPAVEMLRLKNNVGFHFIQPNIYAGSVP
jgi:hypothetical protein